MASGRTRKWCFTLNNWTHLEADHLANWMREKATYGMMGREVGAEGTPHLQSFVVLKNPIGLAGLKKINCRAHWEPMGGTVDQSVEYCTKEDKAPFTWGNAPAGAGARTEIPRMVDAIKAGMSDREILEEFGDKALRIGNVLARARASFREQLRNWEMDVRIYWGPPGTGKSRAVWEEFGVENVYPKMVGKWWDGYRGQSVVLIDDFDPEHCFGMMFDFYLKLLDRYPMMIEWKGGSGQFYSKTIIFTSNFDPDTWFPTVGNREAFFRRISIIRQFGGTSTEVSEGNTGAPAVLGTDSSDNVGPDEPTWAGI